MFKAMLQAVLVSVLVLGIAGCATTRSVQDGVAVPPGHGLIVFKATSDFKHGQLQYKKFSTTFTPDDAMKEYFMGPDGSFAMDRGETYWVLPVKAGDYMWTKIMADTRNAIFHTTNRFSIAPGEITYVGHISIAQDGAYFVIKAEDQEPDMRHYLEQNYPQYSGAFPFNKVITKFL